MLKKTLTYIARYVLVGILPSALLGLLVKKLEGASKKQSEHADEVLLDASLTAVLIIAVVGFSLLGVRWAVVGYGVDSGMLILGVTWATGLVIMALVVLPGYWAWKRFGFHYGILMVSATVLGVVVMGTILLVFGILALLTTKAFR